jgi:hypothetical protein
MKHFSRTSAMDRPNFSDHARDAHVFSPRGVVVAG